MIATIERPQTEPDTAISTLEGADRQSFEDRAMPFLDLLYRYAHGLTGDAMYADDLVQETMLKAYRSWRQFREGTNAGAWLLTILRNTFNTEYRKAQRSGIAVDIDDLEPYVVFDRLSDADPEGLLPDHTVDLEVEAAVERVPQPFREAFLLKVEGLDYGEIADVIGIPLGTVKSRISRARSFLRRELLVYAVREGYIRAPRINHS